MGKKALYTYLVEGECEVKIITILKENKLLQPGKIKKINIATTEISKHILRTIDKTNKNIFILVFDLDILNDPDIEVAKIKERIHKNIKTLNAMRVEVIIIPQNLHLEDELKRATTVSQIKEILNSQSNSDWKRDMLRVNNLMKKLNDHDFNIEVFWASPLPTWLSGYDNAVNLIKII